MGELASALFDETIIAAREFGVGRTPGEYRLALENAGVTALDGLYATLCADVARGDEGAYDHLHDLTPTLGSGQTPIDLRSGLEDVHTGPLALLRRVDRCPSIVIEIHSGFFDRRRDQREECCRVIATLAQGCDVRLVASGLVQQLLREHHRGDLPSFSTATKPRHDGRRVKELAETAHAELDHDSTEVRILRTLADEPMETLAYTELTALFPVTASRISQCLAQLEEFDLVERFGPRTDVQVELRPAGSAFLRSLDQEIGQQVDLEAPFSESGKSYDNIRIPPCAGQGGEDRAGQSDIIQVSTLGRSAAAGAVATSVENGIGLVECPVDHLDDGRIPLWWYDEDADRLIVGAGTKPTNT